LRNYTRDEGRPFEVRGIDDITWYADAIHSLSALAIREKALGPDHPDVATAMMSLA
jgi:hypothetical protein